MQQILEKQVKEYCDRHQMLERGDRVVLGVSGGADSVCLLFVLLALRRELDLQLHVVHVNHGIRIEAGEDAAYVSALCEAHQVPFICMKRISLLWRRSGAALRRRQAGGYAMRLLKRYYGSSVVKRLRWHITAMTGQRPCCFICFEVQD